MPGWSLPRGNALESHGVDGGCTAYLLRERGSGDGVPEDERVEKTVVIKAYRACRYGNFIKLIDAVEHWMVAEEGEKQTHD